jgi:hypothetical protein
MDLVRFHQIKEESRHEYTRECPNETVELVAVQGKNITAGAGKVNLSTTTPHPSGRKANHRANREYSFGWWLVVVDARPKS